MKAMAMVTEPVEYIASIGMEPSGTIIGLDSHPERRAAMRIDFESGDRVIMSKGLIDQESEYYRSVNEIKLTNEIVPLLS
jgi:hypothetical protein